MRDCVTKRQVRYNWRDKLRVVVRNWRFLGLQRLNLRFRRWEQAVMPVDLRQSPC